MCNQTIRCDKGEAFHVLLPPKLQTTCQFHVTFTLWVLNRFTFVTDFADQPISSIFCFFYISVAHIEKIHLICYPTGNYIGF